MNLSTRTPFRRLAVLLLAATPAFAQCDTATVLGTIRDASNLAVATSAITLTNVLTGVSQTAAATEVGDYQFVNVKIGKYRVTAEAKGFRKAASEEFTVSVNACQRVDLALPVGDVAEVVTVDAAAAQLETDNSYRGQVIGGQQVVDLPLNGRNYADLALLVPGVRKSDLAYDVPPRDASFNVNRMRSSQNNFLIDGVDNNFYGTSNQDFTNQVVQLSPDAVQEFKVETSSYNAEYGRAGGPSPRSVSAAAPTSSTAPAGSTCATPSSTPPGSSNPPPASRRSSRTSLAAHLAARSGRTRRSFSWTTRASAARQIQFGMKLLF